MTLEQFEVKRQIELARIQFWKWKGQLLYLLWSSSVAHFELVISWMVWQWGTESYKVTKCHNGLSSCVCEGWRETNAKGFVLKDERLGNDIQEDNILGVSETDLSSWLPWSWFAPPVAIYQSEFSVNTFVTVLFGAHISELQMFEKATKSRIAT